MSANVPAIHSPSPMNAMIPRSMSEAVQLAELMSRGKMMPEHLRNPGDALMVIEQAMRWSMSPYAVAQATFSIKGKLLFAGTLVAAAIEHSGAIVGLMDYQFSGEGPNRKITVSATRKGEASPRTVEVLLKDAQTENINWKKQPDQQLVYHGARVWARRWTPGVMLGVYTPEEMSDGSIDAFSGTTIDVKPEPETPTSSDKDAAIQRWLTKLAFELSAPQTAEEIDAILARDDVVRAQDKLQNGHRGQLQHLINEAIARASALETSAPNEEVADATD